VRTIKTVIVKGVTIGEGRTKILVPITGPTLEALRAQVAALIDKPADVVEWRVDHFDALADTASVISTARTLAEQLGGTPLLFTCRTRAEGGKATIDAQSYGELNAALVQSGFVDLVDVEYQREGSVVEQVLSAARTSGVPVIASNHEFGGTPAREEIVARLQAMQQLGADICKIAVMPKSAADVVTLLDATQMMHEQHAERPLITVAMGGLGLVSRLAGQVFGSAATFGMVGAASAPGQIELEDLLFAIDLLGSAAMVHPSVGRPAEI
jgi:3-dehydroquinate dehydratase-1